MAYCQHFYVNIFPVWRMVEVQIVFSDSESESLCEFISKNFLSLSHSLLLSLALALSSNLNLFTPPADSAIARGSEWSLKSWLGQVKIVFVDDEAANRRLGQRMLAKLGVPPSNVTVLSDGESFPC